MKYKSGTAIVFFFCNTPPHLIVHSVINWDKRKDSHKRNIETEI